MIMVGMKIADRYEIIEKIGTGGMSDVYRAMDHKLNRFVAVKVLKQEFSENSDFVSKFRIEAQAAAGLMHPNIVNVYDVGEEDNFHYIVMELVEGITLKKYIEKKARLSVKEAVSIAIQVSMGIEAAHNNHIIHRDIKPQNIIISKEGKVKVTDFGIAKAATSNTITSNVMGSVHYTSPEQVRGGFSDEKSDIYSLGITLYEMLTGRVPFNGDTTVSVAIKHIQDPMPSPRDFVPEIPISVEQIVLKCTQKSPDRRYQSAPELIEDLKKSLISPDENFVKIDDTSAIGATKNFTEMEMNTIREQARQRDNYDEQISNTASMKKEMAQVKDTPKKNNTDARKNSDVKKTSDAKKNAETKRSSDETDRKNNDSKKVQESKKSSEGKKNAGSGSSGKKNSEGKSGTSSGNSKNKSSKNGGTKKTGSGKKKKNGTNPKTEFLSTVVIVLLAIVIGGIFLVIIGKVLGMDTLFDKKINENAVEGQTAPVEMQNVVGLDVQTAENTLAELGITVSREYQESSEIAENTVISTSVAAGDTVEPGTVVTLVVSSGTNGSVVPNVEGLSKAEATATLENEGYVVSSTKENSATVAKDNVISQNPAAGEKVPLGTTINIVVSLGGETTQVVMPSIVGKSEDEAVVLLVENGLVPKAGVGERSEYDEGVVYYQNYSAGVTVNTGTEVEYRVSTGHILFNCSYSVTAPEDYAGGDAEVLLVSATGQQLYSSTTSSFPVEINVSNIDASSGQLTVTYNVNESTEVTDADGNVTVQNVQVKKTQGPTTVNFTPQN